MPLYEYQCNVCGKIITALILKSEEENTVACDRCRSCQVSRILSPCTTHKTEAQRIDELNAGSRKDDRFYKDERNVGLWAQKRAKELGVDLGSGFNEKLEQARSGRMPDLND